MSTQPNLGATVAALHGLAADGTASVASHGSTVLISDERHIPRSVSDSGLHEQQIRTIVVLLDEAAGTYHIRHDTSVTARGWQDGGYRALSRSTSHSGVVIEYSAGRGGDGAVSRESYDSRAAEAPVVSLLTAHGWQRHRGFWAKLFRGGR